MNRADRLTISFSHELLPILGLSFVLILTIYLLPIPALRIILGVLHEPFFAGCALAAALFAGSHNLEKAPEQSLHCMSRAEKQSCVLVT